MLAIVIGKPQDNGNINIINKAIKRHPNDINKMIICNEEGKPSITHYSINKIWNYKKNIYTMVDIQILTGR